MFSILHSRHIYKRGRFKGDAPADPTRRGKTHFRIVKDGELFGVIFHNTQIVTAYPDGRVKLRANGWENSVTTRDAFSQVGFVLRSQWNNGYKNVMVRGYVHGYEVNDWYVFHEDMMLDSRGVLIGEPKPQYKYVADRAARKEFDTDAAEFRKLIPLLLATSAARMQTAQGRMGKFEWRDQMRYVRSRTDQILQLGVSEQYADLVDAWSSYAYDDMSHSHCPKRLWSAIRSRCVSDMRRIVEVSA